MPWSILTCCGLKTVENEKRVQLQKNKLGKWIGIVSAKKLDSKKQFFKYVARILFWIFS